MVLRLTCKKEDAVGDAGWGFGPLFDSFLTDVAQRQNVVRSIKTPPGGWPFLMTPARGGEQIPFHVLCDYLRIWNYYFRNARIGQPLMPLEFGNWDSNTV